MNSHSNISKLKHENEHQNILKQLLLDPICLLACKEGGTKHVISQFPVSAMNKIINQLVEMNPLTHQWHYLTCCALIFLHATHTHTHTHTHTYTHTSLTMLFESYYMCDHSCMSMLSTALHCCSLLILTFQFKNVLLQFIKLLSVFAIICINACFYIMKRSFIQFTLHDGVKQKQNYNTKS